MTVIKLRDMTKEQFDQLLQSKYNGKVTPINRYSNHQTTMLFQCDSCRTRFYGRPDYLLGARNGQTHECFTNYGSSTGYRDKPYKNCR